jgi:hypothetical protein
MSHDNSVAYLLGVYRAMIVTILFLGMGVSHFLFIYTWIILAAILGHLFVLEQLCGRPYVMGLRRLASVR